MLHSSKHNDPLEQAIDFHEYMAEYEPPPPPVSRVAIASEVSRSSPRESSALPSLLETIRFNESRGDYSAYNASGCEGYGCYGAYQMHGLYMDDWARRYGAAAYANTPATQWPADIQDKVALGLFYSSNPDGEVWCRWTDYC
jgi:hypothetical protein